MACAEINENATFPSSQALRYSDSQSPNVTRSQAPAGHRYTEAFTQQRPTSTMQHRLSFRTPPRTSTRVALQSALWSVAL